jgi:hypothetical protein
MGQRINLAGSLACLALAACGGGGSGSSGSVAPPVVTRSIGGSLSGLEGSLVLQNNGAGNLTLSANGAFTFAAAVADGAAYNVTVLTQPDYRQCTVANGQGTAVTNVTHISVSCVYADQRRWGATVVNTPPASRGYVETGWTALGRDRIISVASYRNDDVTPNLVSAWSGDFDPALRSWSSFQQLTPANNTGDVRITSAVVSGAQGDALHFALSGFIQSFARGQSGAWAPAAWNGQHRNSGSSDMKSVALADGTIYLVWRDYDAARTPQYILMYRILRQGVWSAPIDASTQVTNVGGYLLRTDGTRALLLWQGNGPALQFCVLGDAGCEQGAVVQPTTANLSVETFEVRSDGSALATWRDGVTFRGHVRGGGAWSAATDLGARPGASTASFMGAAALPDGFVVFGRADNVLLARLYRGSWGAWMPLGPAESSSQPAVAVDSGGNVTVVWKLRTDANPGAYPLRFNRFDAASSQWGQGGVLVEDSWQYSDLDAAVDSRGNVLVSWSSIDPPDAILHTALFDATEAVWRTPKDHGTNGFAEQLYFDRLDRGVIVWLDYATNEWKANTYARNP